MAVDHQPERDGLTGYLTTGHEWNGIAELNTPVPRPVYVFLAMAVAFAVLRRILLAAWPLGVAFTKGLLAADQRVSVARDLRHAAAARADWSGKIETLPSALIQADPSLMQ